MKYGVGLCAACVVGFCQVFDFQHTSRLLIGGVNI